jgi:hypothetical protein
VVFRPDSHLMIPYASLEKYCYAHGVGADVYAGVV